MGNALSFILKAVVRCCPFLTRTTGMSPMKTIPSKTGFLAASLAISPLTCSGVSQFAETIYVASPSLSSTLLYSITCSRHSAKASLSINMANADGNFALHFISSSTCQDFAALAGNAVNSPKRVIRDKCKIFLKYLDT